MSPRITAPFATAKKKLSRRIDERYRREEGGLPIFLPLMTGQKSLP